MTALRVVPESGDVTVWVTANVAHRCPYVDEVDEGTVTIAWMCGGASLELHSLRAYLDAWAPLEVSHEAFVDRVRHDIASVSPLLSVVDVTATFKTAGMSVEVGRGMQCCT